LGWPYFSWSAGYDTDNRFRIMKKILESSNKSEICTLLRRERIDFVEIQYPTQIEEVRINYLFYEDNFNEIFNDAETKIKLYDVNTSCKSYI
jgi:hypothetical protein